MTWRHKEIEPWVPCPSCNTPLVAGPAQMLTYFSTFPAAPPCPTCSAPVDWWATIVAALEDNFFFVKALELVGARSTVLVETLKRDSPLEIDLDTAGIPTEARILAVNITPQGSLFPAEVRQHYFANDHIRHKLFLHPVQLGDQAAPEEVILSVMVTWFRAPGQLEGEYLFDALHGFAVETRTDQLTHSAPRWDRLIIPANLALELVIGRLVSDALKKHSFRAQGFNYFFELDPLLPLVAELLGVQRLPVHIAKVVDELRAIRNNIIHEGAPKVPLTRADAARLLASALFAFHYAMWVRQRTGL